MARILIVDDDRSFRDSLGETLVSLGHVVTAASDGDEAMALLAARALDLALVDLRMPGRDGLDVLRSIRADPHLAQMPVALLTAHADAGNTIEAMKLGAFDHLTKPIGRADLVDLLARALPAGGGPASRSTTRPPDEPPMIGASPAMRAVQKLIGIAAASDATVLIQGETGTGKELVARAIHDYGDRGTGGKPFVAINCAAIPADLLESELFGHERGAFSGAVASRAGRFREADGGTLLLDEIGEMTMRMQGLLLRFMETGERQKVGSDHTGGRVDVRVIAATNRNLRDMVSQGSFREDLFYRLNVLRIELPPLRERGSDILALAERLIERYAKTPKRFTAEANAALLAHAWRGNVVGCDDLQLDPARAPADAPPFDDWLGLDFATAIGRFEKLRLERALAASGNNRSEAARRLGIHRPLLYAKLKEHALD